MADNEEREMTWEEYVLNEANTVYRMYLPFSKSGAINIKYKHPVDYTLEDNTAVYKDNVCTGVVVTVELDFENELTIETE